LGFGINPPYANRDAFIWDGDEVFDWQGSGSGTFFVRGADLARALGAVGPIPGSGVGPPSSTVSRHYRLDALGSVQAVDGTRYTTDAWGEVLAGGGLWGNYYDYLGGLGYWHDQALDQYYVRARWYDPQPARWLSVDPVTGEPRYSYVRNRPTVEVDPAGLQARRRAGDRAIVASSFPHAGTLSAYERTGPPPPPPSLEMIVHGLEGAWIEGARWVSRNRLTRWVATNALVAGPTPLGPLAALFARIAYNKGARDGLLRLAGEGAAFLVPPAVEDRNFLMYAAGFYWSMGELIVTGFPLVGWTLTVKATLEFIGAALKNPNVWGELLKLHDLWLKGFKEDLGGAGRGRIPMDPETFAYHDGKAAGRFLAPALGIVLLVAGSAGYFLYKNTPALSKFLNERLESFRVANAQAFGAAGLGARQPAFQGAGGGTVSRRIEETIVREGGEQLTPRQKWGIDTLFAKGNEPSKPSRYIFRGDKDYRGGAIGIPLSEAHKAEIQDFAEHVLRKNGRSSRYVSFSEALAVALEFAGPQGTHRVTKALMSALRELEAAGQVKIWTVDKVYEAMKNGPKEVAAKAEAVRYQMSKNRELLIEGQIPADILRRVQ
jgi:RHS repeat-associated protein